MQSTNIVLDRDEVFVAGGSPTFTYVARSTEDIETSFQLGMRARGQVVSVCGPSKCGKTVFCGRMLRETAFVWVSAGEIVRDQNTSTTDIWKKVCYILNYPIRINVTERKSLTATAKASVATLFSFEGSTLRGSELSRSYEIDSMESAIRHLKANRMALVVDDFHYLPPDVRTKFARNIKTAVYEGLKVVLVSVPFHGLDVVKAEPDLEGRVYVVAVPDWNLDDLMQIGAKGFLALNVVCPEHHIHRLAGEAQQNPLLMQSLCSAFCVRFGIDQRNESPLPMPSHLDLVEVFTSYAEKIGNSTFARMDAGPTRSRSKQKYSLRFGADADVYRVLLMALASVDASPTISLSDLHRRIEQLVPSIPPTKAAIAAALKYFSSVSEAGGRDQLLDWLPDEQLVHLGDPYFRYYLRWKVRPTTDQSFVIRELAKTPPSKEN